MGMLWREMPAFASGKLEKGPLGFDSDLPAVITWKILLVVSLRFEVNISPKHESDS